MAVNFEVGVIDKITRLYFKLNSYEKDFKAKFNRLHIYKMGYYTQNYYINVRVRILGHIFLQIPLLKPTSYLMDFLRVGFLKNPLLLNKKWDF